VAGDSFVGSGHVVTAIQMTGTQTSLLPLGLGGRESGYCDRITWLTWTFRTTQNNHWCHAHFSKEVANLLHEMGKDSVALLADSLGAFRAATDSVGSHEPDPQHE
jgi:hypothetical protein